MRSKTGVVRLLVAGGLLAVLACQRPARPEKDWAYRYRLVVEQPLICYLGKPPGGLRQADIPVGDTLTAESASYLTGVPAYSQVRYRQQAVWVFGALSQTRVVDKQKVFSRFSKKPRS